MQILVQQKQTLTVNPHYPAGHNTILEKHMLSTFLFQNTFAYKSKLFH